MRMLHTSDWHLGRSFGDHQLLGQQSAFCDWLVDLVKAEDIDLVTIAGDLFDRSVPPAAAIELFHDTLRRLIDSGADVAAIAGNHDSAERIGSTDGLLTEGLILRGGFSRAASPVIRQFDDGPLAIVAVPFLDPVFAPTVAPDTLRSTHETVLRHVTATARADLALHHAGMRSIVIAHAFVSNAEPSDSERSLAVGDAGMVSAQVFEGFNYVALGHLHRPQTVGAKSSIRYSGSPLPYSFGETAAKEVVIIDLGASGNVRATTMPVGVGRGVATVRGSIADLVTGATCNQFARIELTDAHPVADASRRLQDRFPYLVEITRIARRSTQPGALTSHATRTRSRQDLAADFMRAVTDAPDADDVALLQAAVVAAEQA